MGRDMLLVTHGGQRVCVHFTLTKEPAINLFNGTTANAFLALFLF